MIGQCTRVFCVSRAEDESDGATATQTGSAPVRSCSGPPLPTGSRWPMTSSNHPTARSPNFFVPTASAPKTPTAAHDRDGGTPHVVCRHPGRSRSCPLTGRFPSVGVLSAQACRGATKRHRRVPAMADRPAEREGTPLPILCRSDVGRRDSSDALRRSPARAPCTRRPHLGRRRDSAG